MLIRPVLMMCPLVRANYARMCHGGGPRWLPLPVLGRGEMTWDGRKRWVSSPADLSSAGDVQSASPAQVSVGQEHPPTPRPSPLRQKLARISLNEWKMAPIFCVIGRIPDNCRDSPFFLKFTGFLSAKTKQTTKEALILSGYQESTFQNLCIQTYLLECKHDPSHIKALWNVLPWKAQQYHRWSHIWRNWNVPFEFVSDWGYARAQHLPPAFIW